MREAAPARAAAKSHAASSPLIENRRDELGALSISSSRLIKSSIRMSKFDGSGGRDRIGFAGVKVGTKMSLPLYLTRLAER